MKKIVKIFDALEDKIRQNLSRSPVLYAIIGLFGTVFSWRGIWGLADAWGIPPLLSLILGLCILLSTGLLVAIAIGDEVLLNAFRGKKKITEISLEETLTMAERVDEIKNLLDRIEKKLGSIKKEEEKIEKEIDKID